MIDANNGNLALSREYDAWVKYLSSRSHGVSIHSGEVVATRLAQRVLELIKGQYSNWINKNQLFPPEGEKIECDNLSIKIGLGSISVSRLSAIRALCGFYLRWTYVLTLLICPKVSNSWKGKCSLVMGTDPSNVMMNGSTSAFINFCDHGPLIPLHNSDLKIVQCNRKISESLDPRYIFSRRPESSLIRIIRIGLLDRCRLLFCHFKVLFQYTHLCAVMPEASIISHEVCFVAPIAEFDRLNRISTLLFNCALYGGQPLWTRSNLNSEIHMVWYAQNFKPVKWLSNPIDSSLVEISAIHTTHHWVWTKPFGEYLLSHCKHARYTDVGPILWYLPNKERVDLTEQDIVIFDVSPYSDEIALQHGQYPNYNSPQNLSKFINDILDAVYSIEEEHACSINVSLKTKRGYKQVYDRAYFQMLEGKCENKKIKMLKYNEDIYSIIKKSSVAIIYPFSSPAYIAQFLKVPFIYYDPTGAIEEGHFATTKEGLCFTSNIELLKLFILEHTFNSNRCIH